MDDSTDLVKYQPNMRVFLLNLHMTILEGEVGHS